MIGGQGALERFLIEPEELAPMRPTFTAWLVLASGKAHPLPADGATLNEALASALTGGCTHKSQVVIREHNPVKRETRLHVYAIKRRSAGRWVVRDHVPAKVHDLYPDPLFVLDVTAFEPVEPWKWTPGCDVVGVERSVVSPIGGAL